MCIFSLFPNSRKSSASSCAFPIFVIFVSLPVGMSITTYFAPIAFFLDIIEGNNIGSIPKGYSTLMNSSSAGAKSKAPPQTKQALVFLTTSSISSNDRSTGVKTSILSAVPQGDVIALEDVLGIVNPEAAIIGTKTIDVLSPGIPPIECLSHIIFLRVLNLFPVSTIAFEKLAASSIEIPLVCKAVINAVNSMSDNFLSTTSLTIFLILSNSNLAPAIFCFI